MGALGSALRRPRSNSSSHGGDAGSHAARRGVLLRLVTRVAPLRVEPQHLPCGALAGRISRPADAMLRTSSYPARQLSAVTMTVPVCTCV